MGRSQQPGPRIKGAALDDPIDGSRVNSVQSGDASKPNLSRQDRGSGTDRLREEAMCDNIPMDKNPVTCPYCWWRGKRHPYWLERHPHKACPRCGMPVSDGWLFRTVEPVSSFSPSNEKTKGCA